MGIPEPVGEQKHERYDYRPAAISSSSSSSSSFSSSIPSYTDNINKNNNKRSSNNNNVKGNARPDLLFDLKCDIERRGEKRHEECSGYSRATLLLREQTEVEYVQESLEASEKGFGGPSGCKEAWITALGNDGFLPAVLVLLHTIRKYAVEDGISSLSISVSRR